MTVHSNFPDDPGVLDQDNGRTRSVLRTLGSPPHRIISHFQGTYLAQSHFELKKQKVEKARLKLNDKIHHLYAPIVGNRLLHQSAVEAVEEVHNLPVENVILDICEKKDGNALEDWRCFYNRKGSPNSLFAWTISLIDLSVTF